MDKRYAKQYDDYSCGPIAIFNALIALGHTPNSNRWIYKRCDPNPDYGTLYTTFDRTLCEWLPSTVQCEYIKCPEYKTIRDHLKAGGVAIICEHWQESAVKYGEHYYTIIDIDNDKFLVANRNETVGKIVQLISARDLKVSLIQHKLDAYPPNCQHETVEDDLIYPTAWLLSKKKSRKRKR